MATARNSLTQKCHRIAQPAMVIVVIVLIVLIAVIVVAYALLGCRMSVNDACAKLHTCLILMRVIGAVHAIASCVCTFVARLHVYLSKRSGAVGDVGSAGSEFEAYLGFDMDWTVRFICTSKKGEESELGGNEKE